MPSMTGDKLRMPADYLGEGGHHQAQKSESCRSHVGVISELNNTEFFDANASTATCEQEANSIG